MRHEYGLTVEGSGGVRKGTFFRLPAVPTIGNRFGFTLIEMMVVIAIIGTLAAIAIPNAIAWRNNSQFNAAVREVKSAIEGVRMAAIKSNLPASITFNNTNVFSTQTQTIVGGVPQPGAVITHQLAPGITVNSNFGGNQLTFTNRGMPAGMGTVFVDHVNGLGLDIAVTITGSSRIQ